MDVRELHFYNLAYFSKVCYYPSIQDPVSTGKSAASTECHKNQSISSKVITEKEVRTYARTHAHTHTQGTFIS